MHLLVVPVNAACIVGHSEQPDREGSKHQQEALLKVEHLMGSKQLMEGH